ncbi:DUF3558 domain-containing protein [Actinokineospora sp. NBRC 105648]|uniref:DUF3558 domain-containing protein n=1 Tax=Actinokineospora sp. NBRC 105648 TaxID=3032206 RepID=UPI002555691D|nr:DUF3558 domain-containing protein [Actinokineospora sp. NBRC 105648]
MGYGGFVRRSAWVGAVSVLLLGLAACSDSTAGSPVASGGTTTGTTTKPNTPSTTGSSGPSLKSLDPCELISSSAAKSIGITGAPRPKTTGKSRTCTWRVDKGSIADSYTITLVLFEDAGIKDVVADGEIKEVSVGSHSGVQALRPNDGGCAVAIGVTDKSRVDLQLVGGDSAKLCAPALDAAKLVEPELP